MSPKIIEQHTQQQVILSAAGQLFGEKGVENVSMEQIATAVGYTRRTLYAYFKSRDEICMMVFLEDLKTRWSLQKKAMAAAKTGLEKLIVWGETLYEFAVNNPHASRLELYWDYNGVNPEKIHPDIFSKFEQLNSELAEGLKEIFKLGISDNSIRSNIEIDLTISHYLYTLRAVIHRALSSTYTFARFDSTKYVHQYLDLFARSIRKKGDINQ